jgi:putative alpha-1,2-mannosidase
MSAWYVLSALGFYPVCPGNPVYILGSPLFPKATIQLDPGWHQGRTFTVITRKHVGHKLLCADGHAQLQTSESLLDQT